MATEKLDLLILKTLELEPRHGYGISRRIEQVSRGVFRVTLGALYPALERLERVGAVRAKWSVSENNRRARYYSLTPTGRRRLTAEHREWERIAEAMGRVLQTDVEPG
ncbi:MAG: PadR family transcriptional regulator [Vicinamibacterales bacterium]